ncbi:DUF4333 domain-containing protein [Sanguibacter sp. 25GB23B1]|uniref:DUF4333 domain-containing protein n=1 Tax=unclassified Sanguibacter TaxID=2645534 RepID=UPI0032AECB9D
MSTPAPYGQVPDSPGSQVPQPPVLPPPPAPQAPAPSPTVPTGSYGQTPQHQDHGPYQQQAQYPQQAPYLQGGPAPTTPRTTSRGRMTTIVVTALVTAALSVTATLLATGAFTAAPLFEQEALESGVRDVLTDDFELTDVDDVECPADVVAQGGEQLECTFTSGGEDLSVPVEVLNDDGQYRVGGPLTEDEAADADEG